MRDYKKIDLDNKMPVLKRLLIDNDLLRYRYFISITKGLREYYKIEDERTIEREYREDTSDMSRYLQNANIDISNRKITLHYDYQGSKKYETEVENLDDYNDYNDWLEGQIIKVINKMLDYYYG